MVDSSAWYNLTESIALQVEHMAVEFVVESFHPSGPSLWTMETLVFHPVMPCWHQLFHPLWETHGWREHLILSPYRSKGPAHCPTDSELPFILFESSWMTWWKESASYLGTKGIQASVVISVHALLSWLCSSVWKYLVLRWSHDAMTCL